MTNLLLGTPAEPPAIPSVEAAELSELYAPNAEAWRKESEALRDENARLKAELKRERSEIERLEKTQWKTFTATAYTPTCAGCSGITKTGIDVRNTTHHNGYRVIATDPSVVPLGTVVEIRFPSGTTERAIAADVGGAIKANKIDYLVSDYSTAIQFGSQSVEIRIISEEA